jgi:uncharacterized protein with GYD domain
MIFVSLAKWRRKPSKQILDEVNRYWDHFKKENGRLLHAYWTFGRYDAVITLEAPDEKSALRALMRWGDLLETETLLAIPRDEALRLIE